MLAIDATGLLSWGGGALAGIQRIEDFLIKAAFADPDPNIEVVALDLSSQRFRRLYPFEQEQLSADHIAPFRVRRWAGSVTALRQAFKAIRNFPMAKREADRQLASMAANGDTGLRSIAARLLFRAYRLYRRARLRFGWSKPVAPLLTDVELSTVLISHQILVGDNRAPVSNTTNTIAFLCHDLIPTIRPDLVSQGRVERAFGPNLESLVRSGATAFCTSRAAGEMLTSHMGQAGISLAGLHRFPMPSLLHEAASRRNMTSRLEAGEPFVLYCSTIEVRKNHIMLARIWKQALDEGVKLPKLVCVGRWGWMIDELKAYLKSHPELAQSIVFTGPISDDELIRHYRTASFGVFPSHIEGWGYAASECLDFGVPVIVSTTPSLIEATGGLMPAIDSTDQAGWYASIRRMTEDKAWHAALADSIARQHRPTSVAASWAVIKAGLQATAASAALQRK